MGEMHPDELDLLAYAEGERDDLRGHVSGCAECSAAVRELEAARTALRSAPLLGLPEGRVGEIVAGLPARPRVRRLSGWPRLAVLAAPVAAALVAVSVVSLRGEDAPGPEAQALRAESAGQERATLPPVAADSAAAAPKASLQAPVAEVQGPPQEVVTLLRRNGLFARRAGQAVEVRGLEVDRVLEVLQGRPDGPVEIRTEAP